MIFTAHANMTPGTEGAECDNCGYAWKAKSRRKMLQVVLALGGGAADQMADLAKEIEHTVFCDSPPCLKVARDLYKSLFDAVASVVGAYDA